MVGEQTHLLPQSGNVPRFSERTQIDCRDLAVTARLGLESDLLSLAKRRETSALNCRDVHENVVAAFIRLDETVALLAVEPLNSAVCHPMPPKQSGNPPRRMPEDIKSRDGDVQCRSKSTVAE